MSSRSPGSGRRPTQLGAAGRKANQNAPIVVRADEIEYDEDLALTIARGHVEISQNGEVLLADTVTYNQRTDTVTASGNVSLSQPTGEILFADYMELRDSMNEGFAKNVRMLLADRSRLAANTARRTNGNRTELRRGVYSPCDLCKHDPSAPPAWQLKAREIDHDKELKLVEFRDATMEIDGWPVFYSPYLSTPDPSVKRASGFLAPSFGGSNTSAHNVTIPYFLVLGPDKDLTLDAALHHPGGPGARRPSIASASATASRRPRQHQPQQSATAATATGDDEHCAAISTRTACSISTTPIAPASTCSASPIRPICCNSALATRC